MADKTYTLTLPAGMVQGICAAVSKAPWEWAAPIMDAIRGQVAQQGGPRAPRMSVAEANTEAAHHDGMDHFRNAANHATGGPMKAAAE